MKKLLLMLLLAGIGSRSLAQFTQAELHASGLTCAMCSNAINKALIALPFVNTVKSDIKNSSFKIVFKDTESVDIDVVKKAVEDAGFSVAGLKLTGNFQSVTIGDDKHVNIGKHLYHFLHVGDRVLDGEQTITVVDKHFVSSKQFKKFMALTTMPCLSTGKAGTCCQAEGVKPETRVYHVTI